MRQRGGGRRGFRWDGILEQTKEIVITLFGRILFSHALSLNDFF